MKYKDLWEKVQEKFPGVDWDSDDAPCELCEVHSMAWKLLSPEYRCAKCGAELWESSSSDQVVGGDCMREDEEEINVRQVLQCPECGTYHMIDVVPIQYNANHDVYYRGQ